MRAGKGAVLAAQVDGDYQYNARTNSLAWTVDIIDASNRSGAMEFVVPVSSADSFFPVDVSFSATHTLCQVGCMQWSALHDQDSVFAGLLWPV